MSSAELPNNQELSLKKRARRRLVGAVALVLLMVIILPMILQDRVAMTPKDTIKITMLDAPEVMVDTTENPQQTKPSNVDTTQTVLDETSAIIEDSDSVANTATVAKVDESKPAEVKPIEVTPVETKVAEVKPVKTKSASKNSANFTIQLGVYSNSANVKQLQAKLKMLGFVSHTDKISTPKGENVRLRAGDYVSRQEAADALDKLKAAGLSGMVVSNE